MNPVRKTLQEKSITELMVDCLKTSEQIMEAKRENPPLYHELLEYKLIPYRLTVEELRRRGFENMADRYERLMRKW